MAFFGFAALFLTSCGGHDDDSCCTTSTDDSQGKFGSQLNVAEFEGSPDVLPPEALTNPPTAPGALPASVRLTNLPAVAMQGTATTYGSPGSCEAQSFGYGLGSYTAARNPDGSMRWDASQPQNETSAAYLYRWEHNQQGLTCPDGSGATPYLNRLIGHGSPSAQDIPYEANCTYLNAVTLDPNFPNMTRFGLGSYAVVSIKKDPTYAVATIKKLLAAGNAVAFSGLVLTGYAHSPVFTNGVLYGTETVANSGHGQLIVGYDDTIGTPGNTGAFLIQNSFGTIWPPAGSGSTAPAGMAWWSYNTFSTTQSLAATAYPRVQEAVTGTNLTPSPFTGPTFTVTRAYQWSPGSGNTWMIFAAHLASPLNLQTVTLTEPGTGTTIRGIYGTDLADGTFYFQRADGKQFVSGDYGVTLTTLNASAQTITYTGTVTVSDAAPTSPASAPVTAASGVTDSIGDPATVTVSG
ncbi:hypothetical protein BH11ARM2_BH11ARM2_19130 [soil metagenome]